MIKSIVLMICLALPLSLFCADDAPLEGITRPSVFMIKSDRIYVLDKATVSIYNLKDHKLIKTFGKSGEGPREFKYNGNQGRPLSMSFQGDQLVINSTNRMSYFTLDGEYLSEKNITSDMLFFQIDKRFVGVGPTSDKNPQEIRIGFRFYDPEFKPQTLIYLSTLDVGTPNKLTIPVDTFAYNPVYKDQIYINTSSEEFIIDVFKESGKKAYRIEKKYPFIPLGQDHKKLTHEFFKTHPLYKSAYEMISKALIFRDHFPPIRDIHLAQNRIHVITYKRQGELWEMIVLDLQGKELGKTFIPLSTYEPFSFYPILYSVYKNSVYTLVEDADDEGWLVKTTPLNL